MAAVHKYAKQFCGKLQLNIHNYYNIMAEITARLSGHLSSRKLVLGINKYPL